MKPIARKLIIWFSIASISVTVGIYLAFHQMHTVYGRIYANIYWLPFAFALTSIALIPIAEFIYSRISISIITGYYFVRMVVVPCVMVQGGYYTPLVHASFLGNMDFALSLMCYEALVSFCFIYFVSSSLRAEDLKVKPYISKTFYVLVFMLIAYVVLLILFDPSILRSNFILLIGTPKGWRIEPNYARLGSLDEGTLGIFVTTLNIVFWLLQAFLPPILLARIAKKHINMYQKIIYSFFVIAIVMIVATETRAHSLECALASLLLISNFYYEKIKKFLPFCFIFGGVVVIYGLMEKMKVGTNGGIDWVGMGSMVSAYFSGPQNVAAGIYAIETIQSMSILNLLPDMILKIPFIGSYISPLFDGTSNDLFNVMLSFNGYSTGQILPIICQGYEYVGFFLAPILPCLFIWLAIKCEVCARNTHNIIMKNCMLLFAIMFARCLMVNMISGVDTIFNVLLTYFLAMFASQKKHRRTVSISCKNML